MQTIYQKVTDQIVAQLKAGTTPWIRSWSLTDPPDKRPAAATPSDAPAYERRVM
jgi:antirestriction protein ArdC